MAETQNSKKIMVVTNSLVLGSDKSSQGNYCWNNL